jgi:hypothetical protein
MVISYMGQDLLTPTSLISNVTPFNNILIDINFIKIHIGIESLYHINYLCKIPNKSKIIWYVIETQRGFWAGIEEVNCERRHRSINHTVVIQPSHLSQ